ncbi:MAG: hypothetical protein N2316_09685, partial [Spirochaetes bacterium]|nr:hypothetical protein [Spirochaetota bacterium]
DLLPMRLRKINSVAEFVKALQGGLKPQFIVITDELSKGDIVVIKNRCSNAELVVIERGKMSFEVTPTQQKDNNEIAADRRASDIVKEININMFSNNPVFLARLHLRELNLAKVNQLLFDFDLSVEDAEYILSFLNTMIARAKGNVELERNIEKICALKKSFLFYINLIKKNDAEIKKMIQECNSQTDVAAYRTLLEKVKQIHNGTEEVFSFVDYENLLFEQNERLRLLR